MRTSRMRRGTRRARAAVPAALGIGAVVVAGAGCGSSSGSSGTTASAGTAVSAPGTTVSTPGATVTTPGATVMTPVGTATVPSRALSVPSKTLTTQGGAAGGTAGASAAPPHRVSISADPTGRLRFTTDRLVVAAGKDTFVFHNPSSVGHNFAIKDGRTWGPTKTITKGTATLTATLQPGTYTFYCAVPGHEAAGMKGTLVVR
jgi:plastocyanin